MFKSIFQNAKMVVLISSAFLSLGCIAPRPPVVERTESWEGRYESIDKAVEALYKAKIEKKDKGVQIWILQPSTLSRLLRNAGQN